MGNNLYESANYSGRLQPKELRLGTASGTSDVWKLGFEFLTATTQRCSGVAVPGNVLNNGNVTAQVLTLPLKTTGTGSARIEYCYDDLNRISSAVESVTSPQTGGWTEAWNYDEVGNLWQTSVTGAMVNGKLTPTASSQCDRNTNRLVKSSTAQTSNDVTYTDSRGNMTSHPSLGSMTYDAEDRLMSAGTTTFAYDAEGRRVKKCVPSGVTQACTYFLYDIGGQLVAEYGANVQAQATTQYMTVDHLGSTRVVTDSAGAVVSRVDYEPFGQEIPAQGADLRSNVNGYNGASGVEVKFTGKERDAETGLDYFGARYMSSAQGRFTSADPKGFSMRTIGNPQKWNVSVRRTHLEGP